MQIRPDTCIRYREIWYRFLLLCQIKQEKKFNYSLFDETRQLIYNYENKIFTKHIAWIDIMEHKKHTLLLGAHISIAGGLEQAIYRGESIDCTVIQIFTKNNRQWFAKPLTKESIHLFKKAWHNSTIQSVVAHACYLINLGSPNIETRKKSTKSLAQELSRCTQLGIPYLVLHPGSKGEMDEQQCLQQIAQQINVALESTPDNTTLLLETLAGQGSNLCYRFEQLAQIYQLSQHKNRLGICFDTCHVFTSGYDKTTERAYEAVWKKFDNILGLDLLKVIHVNDSKKPLGSRVDRHEHIGKGALGFETFRLLFNDNRFFDIPKILETPKENLADDLRNMQIIRKLITPENEKILE